MGTRTDTVLVVGDSLLARAQLGGNGLRVCEARDLREATRAAHDLDVDVVLVDVRRSGPGAPAMVEAITLGASAPEVVVLTDAACIGLAVEALRRGARCYVLVPCVEGELGLHIRRALDARRRRRRLAELEARAGHRTGEDLSIDALEQQHILQVLQRFGGNKREAAKALRISLKTLYNRLHRYGEM